MILYGNGRADDSAAIRWLLQGGVVLDARIETDIIAPTLGDLPPGVYRVRTPSQWTLSATNREGFGRQNLRNVWSNPDPLGRG